MTSPVLCVCSLLRLCLAWAAVKEFTKKGRVHNKDILLEYCPKHCLKTASEHK